MRLQTLASALLVAVQSVWALPPPEHQRVLVVVDDTNPDITASAVADPLSARGFQVTTAGVKDHPTLMKFGERVVDNVVIVPGRVKALGSTLRQVDLLDFLSAGGNVVALTTPKFSPLALRDLSSQFGIEVSGRGVEFEDAFNSRLSFPQPQIVSSEGISSEAVKSAAVAKISADNEYLLGLVQAPYTSYSWNAGKAIGDQVPSAVSDVYTSGGEGYLAAGLQSLGGSRFVWVGAPELLLDQSVAAQITSWAFQETGKLRLDGVSHASDVSGETHLHYSVDEPLKYCATVEKWNSESGKWTPYSQIEDVQLEFKMLDPYYRLNLDRNGCVSFKAPEQYGMFTFNLDYKRPGLTFLQDKQVVTIRHRANDEWDRSWLISNSWVYLAGISTTVIGFLLFCMLYLVLPSPYSAKTKDAKNTKEPKVHKETKTHKEPKVHKETKASKDVKHVKETPVKASKVSAESGEKTGRKKHSAKK